MKTIFLYCGDFIETQRHFYNLKGIEKVEAGYANGITRNIPDFEFVESGIGKFRMLLKISYNQDLIDLRDIFDEFIKLASKNRTSKSCFTNAICYLDNEQKRLANELKVSSDVSFEISPIINFIKAQEKYQLDR